MKYFIAIAALLFITGCIKKDINPYKPKLIIEVTVIELPPASDSVYNVTLRP